MTPQEFEKLEGKMESKVQANKRHIDKKIDVLDLKYEAVNGCFIEQSKTILIMQQDIEFIKENLSRAFKKIDNYMEADMEWKKEFERESRSLYATKQELADTKKRADDFVPKHKFYSLEREFKTVKKVVYGVVVIFALATLYILFNNNNIPTP